MNQELERRSTLENRNWSDRSSRSTTTTPLHSNDTVLCSLFLLQKKMIRIISFSLAYLAYTRPIFFKLNLLPLCKVVIQRTSIFMYKLMNNMLPAALDYLIIRHNDIHQYNTRQRYQLYMVLASHL